MPRLAMFVCCLALSASAAPAPTRVAHIGLELDGGWSWIKEVAANTDAHLVGVAEANPALLERARKTAPEGTRVFSDYVKMLDELKPEAVTVTVPNSRHLEVVRECAKRHIHVWFQKPMAASAKDAREMDRLAREAEITLMISYHTLWTPAMRAVQAKLESGDVGTIRQIEVRHAFAASKVLSPTYEAQFLNPALHGGGALVDQGTYGLNYVVWTLGRPTRVFATAKTLHPRPGLTMEDEVWVTLDYPGATAIVYGGWWTEPDGTGVGTTRISGSKGEIFRDLNRVTYTPAAAPGKSTPPAQEVAVPEAPPDQRGGIAHFLDCIRNGKKVSAPHSPTVNVLVNEVVEAAYESIRTGHAVAIPKQAMHKP